LVAGCKKKEDASPKSVEETRGSSSATNADGMTSGSGSNNVVEGTIGSAAAGSGSAVEIAVSAEIVCDTPGRPCVVKSDQGTAPLTPEALKPLLPWNVGSIEPIFVYSFEPSTTTNVPAECKDPKKLLAFVAKHIARLQPKECRCAKHDFDVDVRCRLKATLDSCNVEYNAHFWSLYTRDTNDAFIVNAAAYLTIVGCGGAMQGRPVDVPKEMRDATNVAGATFLADFLEDHCKGTP
jgi:hypothetical protein